jgi:hypothetical protein
METKTETETEAETEAEADREGEGEADDHTQRGARVCMFALHTRISHFPRAFCAVTMER